MRKRKQGTIFVYLAAIVVLCAVVASPLKIMHFSSVSEFGSNNWHPNSVGHILATNLLIRDIEHATGVSVPSFE